MEQEFLHISALDLKCRSSLGAEGKVGLHKDTHWKEEELMQCEQKIKVVASWTSRATYDDAITLEGVGDNISKVADRAAKNVVQTRVRQDITLYLPKQNHPCLGPSSLGAVAPL
jgi:hypothetical protein